MNRQAAVLGRRVSFYGWLWIPMQIPGAVPERLPRWQFWGVVLCAVLVRAVLVTWQFDNLRLDNAQDQRPGS